MKRFVRLRHYFIVALQAACRVEDPSSSSCLRSQHKCCPPLPSTSLLLQSCPFILRKRQNFRELFLAGKSPAVHTTNPSFGEKRICPHNCPLELRKPGDLRVFRTSACYTKQMVGLI